MIRCSVRTHLAGCLAALLLLGAAPPDDAPSTRAANLLGHVKSLETGRAIEGATVRLEAMGSVAITSALGYFTFKDVPTGVHTLSVEAFGFEERRVQVRLTEDKSYETTVWLGPDPIELEGLDVSVMPAATFQDLADLYTRMERSAGTFILRDEMESRGGNLIQLLQGRMGVTVTGSGGTMANRAVILRRAKFITSTAPGQHVVQDCYPAVFVDGRRFSRRGKFGDQPTDLTEFQAADMEAVEIYRGTGVPAEFGGGDAPCGAILIWMRRGPARLPG